LDPLTGLRNRTSFNELLEQALGSEDVDGRLLAVAYIDIDHFKRVNDNFGHDVGDQLLKELGHRIQASVKHSDTVARLGGDEFALIMHLTVPDDLEVVASRLLACIRQPFQLGPHSIQSSVSVGFALAIAGDTASA
ncbi:GGDEF domain-containing protein, partial [Klebsiella pneumoniae]|uniref:GGDEF domain-containing protein n=1 Tax=Klebsiella pneumoniae TaxID=573 RepID=UPI0015E0CEDB